MDPEIKLSYEYSRKLTKIYSKSFYLSTLLLPSRKRNAVFGLYGFCRFVDNLVDKIRNRSKKEIIQEIQALEKELEIAYRSGESEHPILCSFIDIVKQYHIPILYPLDLLKGVSMDILNQDFKNFRELHLFCYRVAGVVGIMMTYILGYTSTDAFKYAEKMGIAMQLTNILRDIQEDKNNGRIYLPLDELNSYNLIKFDIINENYSLRLKNYIKFLVVRANKYYNEAEVGISMLSKECQFAIYSASQIYKNILTKIRHNDFNPFRGRVYVSQLQKIIIIITCYIKSKLYFNQRDLRRKLDKNRIRDIELKERYNKKNTKYHIKKQIPDLVSDEWINKA